MLSAGIFLAGLYDLGPENMQLLRREVKQCLSARHSGYTQQQAERWSRALTFHHQWLVVSRAHALALVQNMADILKVSALPVF
jgi:hypothetical protein